MNAGNRVEVVRQGMHYSTYHNWMNKNAPEFHDEWQDGRYYGFQIADGLRGSVVLVAEHGMFEGTFLCLVRADDNNLFLINEEGLIKIRKSRKAT